MSASATQGGHNYARYSTTELSGILDGSFSDDFIANLLPCVVLRYVYVALRFGANAALGYDYSCAGTSGARYLFLRPINDRVGFPGQSRHILVDFDYWNKVVCSPLLSC